MTEDKIKKIKIIFEIIKIISSPNPEIKSAHIIGRRSLQILVPKNGPNFVILQHAGERKVCVSFDI